MTCLALFSHTSMAAEPIVFSHVWIAEAPPVSKVLAAYMHIENRSDKDIKILSASADIFSSTAFHKTVFKNGMASMQHYPSLTIPAHGHLDLAPGSFHLMLFNPTTPLRAGDHVDFTFTLDNHQTSMVKALVKKMSDSDYNN